MRRGFTLLAAGLLSGALMSSTAEAGPTVYKGMVGEIQVDGASGAVFINLVDANGRHPDLCGAGYWVTLYPLRNNVSAETIKKVLALATSAKLANREVALETIDSTVGDGYCDFVSIVLP